MSRPRDEAAHLFWKVRSSHLTQLQPHVRQLTNDQFNLTQENKTRRSIQSKPSALHIHILQLLCGWACSLLDDSERVGAVDRHTILRGMRHLMHFEQRHKRAASTKSAN